MLWLPPSAIAATCTEFESAGTNVVAGGVSGTRTDVMAVTLAAAEAGYVLVIGSYYNSSAVAGTTWLSIGGVDVQDWGTHQAGWKELVGTVNHAGGDLTLALVHVSEGSSVTYGSGNGQRWSRRLVACAFGSGGVGATGPPGPTGPAGPTGPPCATPPEPCDVEVTAFTGGASDLLQLLIWAVVFVGALTVMTLAWLAVQGMRR